MRFHWLLCFILCLYEYWFGSCLNVFWSKSTVFLLFLESPIFKHLPPTFKKKFRKKKFACESHHPFLKQPSQGGFKTHIGGSKLMLWPGNLCSVKLKTTSDGTGDDLLWDTESGDSNGATDWSGSEGDWVSDVSSCFTACTNFSLQCLPSETKILRDF